MAVLLDPDEVSTVLCQQVSRDLVDFGEAARLLGIKRYGVQKFLQARDEVGKPFLEVHVVEKAKGRQVQMLSREEIAGFLHSHVALSEIAVRMNSSINLARARLVAANIGPVINSRTIGRSFYRIDDVRRRLPQ